MAQVPLPSFKPPVANNRRSPLTHFRGVLKDVRAETYDATPERRASTRIFFDFTDVEVLAATEPYPFPIATIDIPYSERTDTMWEVWSKSFAKLDPNSNPEELKGKPQEWEFKDCLIRTLAADEEGATPTWANRPSQAWQIVALNGVTAEGAPDINEAIIELLDGKSDTDFYAAFYGSPQLRSMPGYNEAAQAIAQRELLDLYMKRGAVTRGADGVYHKA